MLVHNEVVDECIYEQTLVTFDPIIFIKQFLIHEFFPFFNFLSPNLKHQGLTIGVMPTGFVVIFNHWFISGVVFWFILFAQYYYRDELKEGNVETFFLVPILFFSTQKVMVAIKYATMTKKEYTKYMAPNESYVIINWSLQAQLITGLDQKNTIIRDFQLSCSATELSIKLEEVFFQVATNHEGDFSDAKDWNRFIIDGTSKQNEKNKDNIQMFESFNKNIYIPLSVLCTTLLIRTGKPSKIGNIIFGATILNFMTIAFLPYGIDYNPNDINMIKVLMGLSTFIIIFFGIVVALFFNVAISASSQRYNMALELGLLIRSMNNIEFQDNYQILNEYRIYNNAYYVKKNTNSILKFRELYQKQKNNELLIERRKKKNEHINNNNNNNNNNDDNYSINMNQDDKTDNSYLPPPIIDMEVNNNVVAYLKLWMIAHQYGKRFKFRLDIYIASILILVFAIMGYQIYLIEIGEFKYNLIFLTSLMFILNVTIIIIVISLNYARANVEYDHHPFALKAHILDLDDKIRETSEKLAEIHKKQFHSNIAEEDKIDEYSLSIAIKLLLETQESLKNCQESMSYYCQIKPIKVLFNHATFGLVYSLFSTMLSFFAYLYYKIYEL